MRGFQEHTYQEAAYAYLCKAFPTGVVWGTDHAGKRTMIQGARLKRRGIIPGIHDLFLFFQGTLVSFELKYGKNDATDQQVAFGNSIKANGGHSFVCWTIEDIEAGCRAAGLSPAAMVMTSKERDARLAVRFAGTKPVKSSKSMAEKPTAARVRKMHALRGRIMV